ncbi:unnamed protein product [Sphagnum jensenii]|uniref:Uncharacterized protein n=1 Tax=Sphagnum jensenii TaxID=128206 RepID=A0ABP1ALF1_9BRYO
MRHQEQDVLKGPFPDTERGGHRGGGGGWGGGQESSPYKATTKWASGDQNEPESSDTMKRGTTADQNEIKCSPLQSRVAVLNLSTSIQDVVSELEMHLEDKYNGTETFPVLDLLDFKPLVTQGGATCQDLMSLEDNELYHGTHGDTKRAAHEMNEPFKLEPNCGASSSRSLPSILQQSLKEVSPPHLHHHAWEWVLGSPFCLAINQCSTANTESLSLQTAVRTTDLGKADTEYEQSEIELEAHVQQDGNGKRCKDEAAGRQAQNLLSSIHQRLQGLKRAIGVIPTPPDYIVEDHCVQHDSESVITFGWRLASKANALELLFQSTKGMSSILGVGLEFAKVLVVPASLEVKIIGIGHASWDELWQDSSNNKDDVIDIVSIAKVRRAGAKLENPSNIEYLTAKQRATKYGVGLVNQTKRTHVNSTDVEPQSDCSYILDKVVEYLVLKKVIDAIMDKQCDGDGGEGSSSGANSTKQGIGGMSSSQSIISLIRSYLSLHERQKPTGGNDDEDDDDETLPSKKRPHQMNHKRPIENFRRVTVIPGHGGSFYHARIPQELGTASIDPTLVFEFNYKLDMNGTICDKQIQITTTTSFDLGKAAPKVPMSDSFGWYQNPLTVSLRNYGDAKLHTPSCQLKETLKETKISAKTTYTHSNNSTLQCATQVEGGCKAFIQVTGSASKTTSNGETIAKEAASENLGSGVFKGFQIRDLRVVQDSLLKYEFYTLPPQIRVLEDPEERYRCLGMGMCEAVTPTFIGTWLITPEDVDEVSSYMFDAERNLNRLVKGDQISEQREPFVQHYRVPMYVNHAMSHLCTLKDHPTLKEREILLNVLKVGVIGV